MPRSGSRSFTCSDTNRMNAVKQGNAVQESYAYNHRGERVLRTPDGGAAQIALYDEAGQWLGNYSATGQVQQQAIWLDNYPVALINLPSSGVPELAYVQPDHLGTPRVVIDPVRDVAIWEWSNKSEVFGDQAPINDVDSDGVTFRLALRFPGQQATDASGLFYNYQREYDPAVGRYSQSDPIGLNGGANTFAYVQSTPLSLVDPHGLQATFADSVSERRWDWGKLGASGPEGTSTTGDVTSRAQVANAAANTAVGSTGSGISAAPHATTWQHAAGSQAGQTMQRAANGRRFGPVQASWSSAGRLLGRVAVVTTVWEGFWNIGSVVYCGCSAGGE
jgi:RHS repeat-associated protein